MSRSSFAARFSDLIGEPPMAYVTTWRMEVAERVGYQPEAAFNRAFRRAHGVTPGVFARRFHTPAGVTAPHPVS